MEAKRDLVIRGEEDWAEKQVGKKASHPTR